MSARSLAGSRANKHRPIARQTLPSDRVKVTRTHYQVGGWSGGRGYCGIECACGTTYDGFDSLREAIEMLDLHIAWPRMPHQADRAVSIGTAFFPAPRVRPSLGAVAGAKGRSAEPMSNDRRFLTYLRQTQGNPTARQQRQLERCWRRSVDNDEFALYYPGRES
jgi:hypothetical protein